MVLQILLLVAFLQFGEAQIENTDATSYTLHTSSINLILENKCATKDEVQALIQAEIEPIRQSMQLLTNYVDEMRNNTALLLQQSGPTPPCGSPGWRQVAFINMTDASSNCPSGLKFTQYPGNKRTCGRAHSNSGDCSSATFSAGGYRYTQVCGMLAGYQVGETSAFYGYLRGSQTIDGWYVDGVSLTHGAPGRRQHIWTYAAGYTDRDDNAYSYEQCPCDVSNSNVVSPPYVGNDYFCESATDRAWAGWYGVFFPDDPLWDGQGCKSTSTCCQFNNPPWFTKTLPNPTSDDVELRICTQRSGTSEDTALERIELYVM